jgi:hypothetical protein
LDFAGEEGRKGLWVDKNENIWKKGRMAIQNKFRNINGMIVFDRQRYVPIINPVNYR